MLRNNYFSKAFTTTMYGLMDLQSVTVVSSVGTCVQKQVLQTHQQPDKRK